MKKGKGIQGRGNGISKGSKAGRRMLHVGKHKEFGNIRHEVGRCMNEAGETG